MVSLNGQISKHVKATIIKITYLWTQTRQLFYLKRVQKYSISYKNLIEELSGVNKKGWYYVENYIG